VVVKRGLAAPFAAEGEDKEGHHEHADEGFDRGDEMADGVSGTKIAVAQSGEGDHAEVEVAADVGEVTP